MARPFVGTTFRDIPQRKSETTRRRRIKISPSRGTSPGGGYRYEGPTYTKHDPYAKALIDEAYWEQIKSVDRENDLTGLEGIYYKSGEEEQEPASNSTEGGAFVGAEPQELDGSSGSRSNTFSSLVLYSMAFVACISTYAMSF